MAQVAQPEFIDHSVHDLSVENLENVGESIFSQRNHYLQELDPEE